MTSEYSHSSSEFDSYLPIRLRWKEILRDVIKSESLSYLTTLRASKNSPRFSISLLPRPPVTNSDDSYLYDFRDSSSFTKIGSKEMFLIVQGSAYEGRMNLGYGNSLRGPIFLKLGKELSSKIDKTRLSNCVNAIGETYREKNLVNNNLFIRDLAVACNYEIALSNRVEVHIFHGEETNPLPFLIT